MVVQVFISVLLSEMQVDLWVPDQLELHNETLSLIEPYTCEICIAREECIMLYTITRWNTSVWVLPVHAQVQ